MSRAKLINEMKKEAKFKKKDKKFKIIVLALYQCFNISISRRG